MDSERTYVTAELKAAERTSVRPASFSPNGRYAASTTSSGVRVVSIGGADLDSTITAWRCTVRDAGFAPSATSATLLLIRRDRAGASRLALWTPSAGVRDLGLPFDGQIDAWWSSEGKILVRAVGDGLGGMWVVDPSRGATVAA